jgi:hypothetical protein
VNPEDLARILDELGQRLGPTGEYVFALAVRQVYINAATSAVALLVSLLFARWAVGRIRAYVARGDSYSTRDVDAGFAYAGLGLLVAATVLWAFLAIPGVLNPEYTALRSLIGAIQ